MRTKNDIFDEKKHINIHVHEKSDEKYEFDDVIETIKNIEEINKKNNE